MACGQYPSLWQYWINGQFFDAVNCPFETGLGPLVWGLMVVGGIGLYLTIVTESLIVPLVLFIIIGSVVVVALPAVGIQLAGIVLLLGLAVAGYFLVLRSRGR